MTVVLLFVLVVISRTFVAIKIGYLPGTRPARSYKKGFLHIIYIYLHINTPAALREYQIGGSAELCILLSDDRELTMRAQLHSGKKRNICAG
jgi:hypothetical protein